ncbi:MAG: rod shape-determining protein MreD, partial [Bryobacteraceae bacterium]
MGYSSGRMLLSQSDGPVSRFRAWVFIVIPLLAILFQVYVPLFFPILNFLEMPLLVVVYLSLTQRSQVGGLL